MEEVNNQPVILNEHYEIEFIEDSGSVYEPGDQMDAADFIDEYCQCNSSDLQDTTKRLKRTQIPKAVAFIAEARGISYKLHHIKTIDEIVDIADGIPIIKSLMEIKQCNRNPFFLADFAYDGTFSDGEMFCLRIPEKDVIPFAEALLKAYADDMNGGVVVTMPHITYIDGKPVFVDGKVERINKKHENQ